MASSYSVQSSSSTTNSSQIAAPSATGYSTGQNATAYAAPPNPPVPTYPAYQVPGASGTIAQGPGPDLIQYGVRPPPPPPPPSHQNVWYFKT